MAISIISLLYIAISIGSPCSIASARILNHSHRKEDASGEMRRFTCGSGNEIDDCWRCGGGNWEDDRKKLADCAIGYGKKATGGKDGEIYVVKYPSDDDAINPSPGTLRHAVLQNEPLWIVFSEDMTISLKEELIMNSHKTIDGRGVDVLLTGNSGINVQHVHNVIIHSVRLTGMKPSGNTNVRSNPEHWGWRNMSDGDAIQIFDSHDVWIDHCTLSSCSDGLVDVVKGSTDVTVSNCHFSNHNNVMLLGHSDEYTDDKNMRVTVAYNVFGEGLTQRMPRCRHGTFEVMNNDYSSGWGLYAIGGTANPTIYSHGNIFVAPNNEYHKQVNFHHGEPESVWQNYAWSSDEDMMQNGAFFVSSGSANVETLSTDPSPAEQVPDITAAAGALRL